MLLGFVQKSVSAVRQAGLLKGIRGFINFTGAGVTVTDDPANNEIEVNIPGGGGGGGHTIKDEGTALTARTGLNFIGAGVTATDDAVGDETEVTITEPDHSTAQPVQIRDEGVNIGLRKNINFVGAGVTATDDAVNNEVDVTIPGTAGTPGHTIRDEGVALTQRDFLNFIGAGVSVTDDAVNNETEVTITEPDHTTAQLVQIRDEGVNVSLRRNLNFVGSRVTVTDDAVNSEADITISAGTGTIHLPIGGAVLSDGSASNATPAIQRVKSSAASPTPHFLQLAADAATDEHWQHQFRLNSDYSSSPVLKLQAKMASATSGNVIIQCRIAAVTPGDATDVDAKAYAAANTSSATAVPGTAGFLFEISLTLTTNDSMAAGDLVIIQINRDADNASDTATGDMEIVAGSIEYTKV